MNCNKCHSILNNDNWLPSRKIKNKSICKLCEKYENSKRYQLNKSIYLQNIKSKYAIIKSEVFDYYGGKCNICNENNYKLLSLDHINKNGRKQRKSLLKTDSGTAFYKYVHKNKPNDLRLLCYNCNCQKSMDLINLIKTYSENCKYCNSTNNLKNKVCNTCQYKLKINYQIILKKKIYDIYGGKCQNCSCNDYKFLTIDHINNDGAHHRKKMSNIYSWLKINNYPKDNYQILCYNCNYLKYHNQL